MAVRAKPSLAAPAAVFLCHEDCHDSGEAVFAEMGRFGRLAVLKGPAFKVEKDASGDAAEPSAEWIQ